MFWYVVAPSANLSGSMASWSAIVACAGRPGDADWARTIQSKRGPKQRAPINQNAVRGNSNRTFGKPKNRRGGAVEPPTMRATLGGATDLRTFNGLGRLQRDPTKPSTLHSWILTVLTAIPRLPARLEPYAKSRVRHRMRSRLQRPGHRPRSSAKRRASPSSCRGAHRAVSPLPPAVAARGRRPGARRAGGVTPLPPRAPRGPRPRRPRQARRPPLGTGGLGGGGAVG